MRAHASDPRRGSTRLTCDGGPGAHSIRGDVNMKPTRGIRRTPAAGAAWVGVRGVMYSKRFPATATLTEMKEWREDTRSRGRAGGLARRTRSGSTTGFAADADRYLKPSRR